MLFTPVYTKPSVYKGFMTLVYARLHPKAKAEIACSIFPQQLSIFGLN